MKELISLAMVAMETEKRQFLSYLSNGCYEGKKHSNLHYKNLVDWIAIG